MSKTTQKRARDAGAIDLTEEASPEKKRVRVKVEAPVTSGAFEDEIDEAATQKLENETLVWQTVEKALRGDSTAMWRVGVWYEYGKHCFVKDKKKARLWYGMSAKRCDPRGMAAYGVLLLEGIGGPQDNKRGLVNVTEAAGLGSNYGAVYLGKGYLDGRFGLPRDSDRAHLWLKKVADDEWEFDHLAERHITQAAMWVRELEGSVF